MADLTTLHESALWTRACRAGRILFDVAAKQEAGGDSARADRTRLAGINLTRSIVDVHAETERVNESTALAAARAAALEAAQSLFRAVRSDEASLMEGQEGFDLIESLHGELERRSARRPAMRIA